MRRSLHCLFALLLLASPASAATGDAPLPPEAQKYWVDNLNPIAVPFPKGWFMPGIRWYGLAYVAGFIVASWLLWLYSKKGRSPLNSDQRSTLVTALILGVLLGGRIGYYLLYRPADLFANPLILLRIWEGGMASHGGFIGGFIALVWFSRASKYPFMRLADMVVTLAPPGILFGRLANFVNGELYGKVASVPWAMIFPEQRDGDTVLAWTEPRHPSQLYEAATEGLLLLIYTQWRFWGKPAPGQPGALPPGQLAGEYLIGYALVRIFCERFREPDASLFFNLSRGTFYSIFMIVLGVIIIWRARQKAKTSPRDK